MNSDLKAKGYFESGKVFPLRNTPLFEFWAVEGETGIHSVRYDKQKEIWTCDCKNIRKSFCSHIKGTLLCRKEFINGKRKE